ncbi:cleavage and polyadenylation specificity factor subunit 6-like [Rhinopithecus roxellana]|uniref:cleavage and polyadenylation specificity factor subunit 6-like n=1 Tax=Rhinopithecus roxellana TaxID=61622 RepID=UPI0012374ECE|nr:cleavage and polyadenylation specificity factor subunit 6-like [Rhinopithecus roxellana]
METQQLRRSIEWRTDLGDPPRLSWGSCAILPGKWGEAPGGTGRETRGRRSSSAPNRGDRGTPPGQRAGTLALDCLLPGPPSVTVSSHGHRRLAPPQDRGPGRRRAPGPPAPVPQGPAPGPLPAPPLSAVLINAGAAIGPPRPGP